MIPPSMTVVACYSSLEEDFHFVTEQELNLSECPSLTSHRNDDEHHQKTQYFQLFIFSWRKFVFSIFFFCVSVSVCRVGVYHHRLTDFSANHVLVLGSWWWASEAIIIASLHSRMWLVNTKDERECKKKYEDGKQRKLLKEKGGHETTTDSVESCCIKRNLISLLKQTTLNWVYRNFLESVVQCLVVGWGWVAQREIKSKRRRKKNWKEFSFFHNFFLVLQFFPFLLLSRLYPRKKGAFLD